MLRKILNHKFSRVITFRKFNSPLQFDLPDGKVESSITVILNFSIKEGLYYSVRLPNYTCSRRKLRDAFMDVLEHEAIGMAKYQRMKELLRAEKL